MHYTAHVIKPDGTAAKIKVAAASEAQVREGLTRKGFQVGGIVERQEVNAGLIPKDPSPASQEPISTADQKQQSAQQPLPSPPASHPMSMTGCLCMLSIGYLVMCWVLSVTILAPDTARNEAQRTSYTTWAEQEADRRFSSMMQFERDRDRGELTVKGAQQALYMRGPNAPTRESIKDQLIYECSMKAPYFAYLDKLSNSNWLSSTVNDILHFPWWPAMAIAVITIVVLVARSVRQRRYR